MQNKKLKPTSSSKIAKESKDPKDDDFPYRFSAKSRSKSTPRRVRFAEKPLCPESDPEDSIIVRDQIEMRMRSGEPPLPILKDTEYVPPKPSYFRLLKRRFIRKTKRNARKIVGIILFLLFSFVLFQLMFRWGIFKTQTHQQKRLGIFRSEKSFSNYGHDEKSPLFVGFNVESGIHSANNQFLDDNYNGTTSNVSGAILAFCMTVLIGVALYFLVL